MVIVFRGGKTDKLLRVDSTDKTYHFFNGVASGSINLDTAKELNKLELKLINEGYKNETND